MPPGAPGGISLFCVQSGKFPIVSATQLRLLFVGKHGKILVK
jgi:hypothetical protein